MLLGSLRFGTDLDLWSLGCVAAELFLREPLSAPVGKELPGRNLLNAHFKLLGTPLRATCTNAWMKSLPFVKNFYGKDARLLDILAKARPGWPSTRL